MKEEDTGVEGEFVVYRKKIKCTCGAWNRRGQSTLPGWRDVWKWGKKMLNAEFERTVS